MKHRTQGVLIEADVKLGVSLYDNSGGIGDSWAVIDNVRLGSAKDDFEGAGLGGFNSSLNPGSVSQVAGSLDGTGNYVMRISEDPAVTPTIVYRDYPSRDGNVLAFGFELFASDARGFWGPDTLVFSLLNPQTLNPLVPGLTGRGDILAISSQEIRHIDAVEVATAIPVPGSLLLTLLGAVVVRLRRTA